MTCTEEYKERIEYTFHAFCKVVIRNATITAARTRSRRCKRERSLEYLRGWTAVVKTERAAADTCGQDRADFDSFDAVIRKYVEIRE